MSFLFEKSDLNSISSYYMLSVAQQMENPSIDLFFVYLVKYSNNFRAINNKHLGAFKSHHRGTHDFLLRLVDSYSPLWEMNTIANFIFILFTHYKIEFGNQDTIIILDNLIKGNFNGKKLNHDEIEYLEELLSRVKQSIKDLNIDDNFDLSDTAPTDTQMVNILNQIRVENTQSQQRANFIPATINSQPVNSIDIKTIEKYKRLIQKNLRAVSRAKNHIKNMQSHKAINTTPESLNFNAFPQPFLPHDESFIEKYNNLIAQFQTNSMDLIIDTLEMSIKELETDNLAHKVVLSQTGDVDSILESISNKVKKYYRTRFQKANDKVRRVVMRPFKVVNKESSSNDLDSSNLTPSNSSSIESSFERHPNSNMKRSNKQNITPNKKLNKYEATNKSILKSPVMPYRNSFNRVSRNSTPNSHSHQQERFYWDHQPYYHQYDFHRRNETPFNMYNPHNFQNSHNNQYFNNKSNNYQETIRRPQKQVQLRDSVRSSSKTSVTQRRRTPSSNSRQNNRQNQQNHRQNHQNFRMQRQNHSNQ